jgi:hypothetical protein
MILIFARWFAEANRRQLSVPSVTGGGAELWMGFVLALHLVRAYSCKMKNTTRYILLSLPLFLISLGYGATVPTMDVTVSSANGKVAYKGTTNANGIFATGNVEPGNYVVEFHSKSAAVKGSKFGIAVSAGKNTVSADAVAGEKLAANGVAMKVAVTAGTKITGQVANGLAATKAVTNASAGSHRRSGVVQPRIDARVVLGGGVLSGVAGRDSAGVP